MFTSIKTRLIGAGLAALIGTAGVAQAADITGAGATFIYPMLSKWSDTYNNKTGNKINYQSIGSGGGIAQIKAGTVDFGSSDKPLDPKELDEARPRRSSRRSIGGVVPVVNIEGVDAGQAAFHRSRCSPTSTSARSPSGTIRRSRRSIRTSSCRTRRSPSCIAPTVRARRSTWSTTSRRFRRSGRRRSAKAPRCSGRSASAARATKASPRT